MPSIVPLSYKHCSDNVLFVSNAPPSPPTVSPEQTRNKLFTVKLMPFLYIPRNIISFHGLGSSVGVATDYGLDGPGSNPGGDEIFRPSRPGLGPAQPPVQWVPCLSRG